MKQQEKQTSLGGRIKAAVGIEGDAGDALRPMFGYSVAKMSQNGANFILELYMLAFLSYVEGLSTGQAAMVLMIRSLWDAVTDPIMGAIVDRTRSRFGRHRVYLLLGAVPFGVSFFFVFHSFGISALGNSNLTMCYYIVAYIFFSTMLTVVFVPYEAMLPSQATGYFQRTQYNSVLGIMTAVGAVPSFLLVALSVGLLNTEEFHAGMRGKFMLVGIILGIFYMIPIFITFKSTAQPSSAGMPVAKFDSAYLLREYVQVFRSRAMRRYFFFFLFLTMAGALMITSRIYFIREVAGQWRAYNILISIGMLAEGAAFPLVFFLTKRFGKVKGTWLASPVLLSGLAIGLFIRPGAGSLAAMVVMQLLISMGLQPFWFTAMNIRPDLTDVDEMITGRKREGVITSCSSFVQKTVNGLVAGFTGVLLEWFGVRVNDSSGLLGGLAGAGRLLGDWADPVFGIRLVYVILPLGLIVLSLVSLRGYRVTRQEQELIQAAVREKHATGATTLSKRERARCAAIAGYRWERMWIGQETVSFLEK
ncbi:MAG: MFS transporter [Clostridiales bacterium]|nr:MFS transporter [Clostridiales bacterium]